VPKSHRNLGTVGRSKKLYGHTDSLGGSSRMGDKKRGEEGGCCLEQEGTKGSLKCEADSCKQQDRQAFGRERNATGGSALPGRAIARKRIRGGTSGEEKVGKETGKKRPRRKKSYAEGPNFGGESSLNQRRDISERQ